MRIFGNLTNRIHETVAPEVPTVGMGATILYYSDRQAATVVEVRDNGKEVVVQEDKAIRADKNGMSETQSYDFEPNPQGALHRFTRRKNGTFVSVGSSMKQGTICRIGSRSQYYDFGF